MALVWLWKLCEKASEHKTTDDYHSCTAQYRGVAIARPARCPYLYVWAFCNILVLFFLLLLSFEYERRTTKTLDRSIQFVLQLQLQQSRFHSISFRSGVPFGYIVYLCMYVLYIYVNKSVKFWLALPSPSLALLGNLVCGTLEYHQPIANGINFTRAEPSQTKPNRT